MMTPAKEAELLDIQRILIEHPLDTDELVAIDAAVRKLHLSLQFVKDPSQPWSGSNRTSCRALLIAGAFRAGKTYLASHVIRKLPAFETPDGQIQSRPVRVKASSSFTVEQLGRDVLNQLQLLPARGLGTNGTMERVATRLPLKRVTLLHIDEAQRLAQPERVSAQRLPGEQVKIFGHLRDILDLDPWPVPIVLTGTLDLVPVLERRDLGFFRDKMDMILIEPMVIGRAKDHEALASAAEGYPELVGMTADLGADGQFYDRLIRASNHAMGLAFEVCREAVLIAASENRKTVGIEDFATYYAQKTGCARQANPFVAVDWHRVDPTVLLAAMTGEKPLRVGELRK